MSLKKSLNLSDAILLVIGNTIGAGIFTTSGFLASELPEPLLFICIWILGGFITLCGALTYAELAGMFPLAGGDYQFLKAAYGKGAGFLLGWVSFWIIVPGSIAALSIALINFLKIFISFYNPVQEKLLAILIIFLFSLINYRGIRLSCITQNVFTIGTIIILITLILCGFFSGKGNWNNFTNTSSSSSNYPNLFSSAMIAVIFTYSGWFASAYIGSEIRNPERNLPLSLILGTLFITAIYTLINIVYLYSLPIHNLKNVVNVAQIAFGNLFNPTVTKVVSLPIILAISGSINATILTGARIFYAMAEDGIFWPILSRVHPLYRTPYYAILSQTILACILVLLGTFNQLLSYVVFVMLFSSIASGVALFILRRLKPDFHRPYHTMGYPFVPLLFVVSYIWIAVQICYSKPTTSILGIFITFSGVPFYIWWNNKKKVPTYKPFQTS